MIRIFADSTNDLGRELIEKYNIRIVPLYVRMGDNSVKDGPELDTDALYAWADANHTTPATAAFSPADAEEALMEAKEAGDDVIFFGISTEMSASCGVFKVAADNLDWSDHVFVVDSRNLSTGIGLTILKAAEMIEEGGRTAAQICEELEGIIPRVRASFVVDTLIYLYRGGRCSAISALMASVLQIKPKIVVKDGSMGVSTKYRGRIDKVINKYVKDMEPQLMRADPGAVFITHSGVSDEIAGDVRAQLEELGLFRNIYTTRAGGVISSHCGPGTLGVLFIEKE